MFLIALILSFTNSAHACPDLTGQFDCTVTGSPLGDRQFHPQFKTSTDSRGNAVYSFGGKQFVLDGQQHYLDTFPGFETWVHGVNYIANCTDSSTIRTRGSMRLILAATGQYEGTFQAVNDHELRGRLHVTVPLSQTDAVVSCVRH